MQKRRWENGLDPIWVAVSARLQREPGARLALVDTHAQELFDDTKYKPDLLGFPLEMVGGRLLQYYIELIADVKDEPLSPSRLQQLERYAMLLFAAQRLRTHVYTFMANHDSIVFVRFQRLISSPRPPFRRTDALRLNYEGGRVLLALLASPKEYLGARRLEKFELAAAGSVVPTAQFGEGASTYAYTATFNGRTVIVKEFKATADAALAAEINCLTTLKPLLAGDHNRNRVPYLHGRLERLVVLSPVATPLHRYKRPLHGAVLPLPCL